MANGVVHTGMQLLGLGVKLVTSVQRHFDVKAQCIELLKECFRVFRVQPASECGAVRRRAASAGRHRNSAFILVASPASLVSRVACPNTESRS